MPAHGGKIENAVRTHEQDFEKFLRSGSESSEEDAKKLLKKSPEDIFMKAGRVLKKSPEKFGTACFWDSIFLKN